MYLDKVISTSERGITGTVNKGEVDVVHSGVMFPWINVFVRLSWGRGGGGERM